MSRDAQPEIPISLRPPTWADVPLLFELQSDPESNRLAGTKPRTREAFFARWEEVLADPNINSCVIELATPGGPEVVGGVTVFQMPLPGVPSRTPTDKPPQDCLGYWLARAHWGRGIASHAVAMFLRTERRRPLHATAATANAASLRILEKCGFRRVGTRWGEETDRYIACEIAEFVLEEHTNDTVRG